MADNNKKESVVALFLGIIDTLDHYENFSEEPEYWNQLLEEEIVFQSELLTQLQSKVQLNTSIYEDRYKMVIVLNQRFGYYQNKSLYGRN